MDDAKPCLAGSTLGNGIGTGRGNSEPFGLGNREPVGRSRRARRRRSPLRALRNPPRARISAWVPIGVRRRADRHAGLRAPYSRSSTGCDREPRAGQDACARGHLQNWHVRFVRPAGKAVREINRRRSREMPLVHRDSVSARVPQKVNPLVATDWPPSGTESYRNTHVCS